MGKPVSSRQHLDSVRKALQPRTPTKSWNSFKFSTKHMIGENKCQIHLKATAVELLSSLSSQWGLPGQCYPTSPPCCWKPVAGPIGEPAWLGERLGELRHWDRPEVMGQAKCGQHWVTTPCGCQEQVTSPGIPSGFRCLIGDEWIVFHWNLQKICRQTMLLFPSQPPLQQEISLVWKTSWCSVLHADMAFQGLFTTGTWMLLSCFRVLLTWFVCPSLTCMREPVANWDSSHCVPQNPFSPIQSYS